MDLKFVIESILFTAQKPLNAREIRDILRTAAEKAEENEEQPKAFRKVSDDEINAALAELVDDFHLEPERFDRVTLLGRVEQRP